MKRRSIAIMGVVAIGSIFLVAAKPDFKFTRNLEILFNVFRELNLLYVDPIDQDKMLEAAAEGATSILDPYTEYIPEKGMEEFSMMTTGKYGGIGSLIKKRNDSHYVQIAEPYRNTPADRAGLKIDDYIVSLNGESMKDATSERVSSIMKGDPGTSFVMEVMSPRDSSTRKVTLKRERIAIPGVQYYGYVADGVGYIPLNSFTENCSEEVSHALRDMEKQGKLESLILDLRDNGGGILQEAVKIVGLFTPKGTKVVYTKGKIETQNQTFVTPFEPIDTKVKLIVIVNKNSASASEIVSGSLQDLDRAVIVGQRTFGKGLVQSTRPVGYNSYVKLTTAKYYIPSGRCIQAINYSKRNPDGTITYIPDSLISEFKTAHGRKVYDGAGIMPDLKLDPVYTSIFTISLYKQGYIEDFVRRFYEKNPTRGSEDPAKFKLTDREYADFIAFMADKNVEIESETDAVLKTLREVATREKFIGRLDAQLKEMEKSVRKDNAENLKTFRSDIQPLIESELILRHHYRSGVIRYQGANDKEILRAIEAAKSTQYTELLNKDTAKK